jgi:ethanolamine transporter EutH
LHFKFIYIKKENKNKEREDFIMNKNQMVKTNKKEMFTRYALLAFALTAFVAFATAVGILPAFAGQVNLTGLDSVMNIVIDIITKAALYIGIIIILWGVFQIVLAFRREDSEGISKQITTIVVGGVLTGFGAVAGPLKTTLMNNANGTGGGTGGGAGTP